MDYLEVQFHVTLSDDFTIGIGLMYIYIYPKKYGGLVREVMNGPPQIRFT